MKIGVPRETKDQEFRVGMTPDGVRALVEDGHALLVEKGAGVGSGFPDEAYAAAGASLVSAEDAWSAPDLVVKVKEPNAAEIRRLRRRADALHLPAPRRRARARARPARRRRDRHRLRDHPATPTAPSRCWRR